MKTLMIGLLAFLSFAQSLYAQAIPIEQRNEAPFNQMGLVVGQYEATLNGKPAVGTNICTGTLISRTHVLTGAHCVFRQGVAHKNMRFNLSPNVTPWSSSSDNATKGIRVKNVYALNNYLNPQPTTAGWDATPQALLDFYLRSYDIAVLELERPLDQTGLPIASIPTQGRLNGHCHTGFPGNLKGEFVKTCSTHPYFNSPETYFAQNLPEIGIFGFILSIPGQSGSSVLNEQNTIVGVVSAASAIGDKPVTLFVALSSRHVQEINLWLQGQTSDLSKKVKIDPKAP